MKIDTEIEDAFQCINCFEVKVINKSRFHIGSCGECRSDRFRRLTIEQIFDYSLTESDLEFLSRLCKQ